MRLIKILAIVLGVYVGIVALFESLIGYFQPANESTLVIFTIDDEGDIAQRVVSRLESDGKVYVATNHWPRAWYHRALAHPTVEIRWNNEQLPHQAIPVTGAEHDRVNADNPLPLLFRFLTGFPPRYFLRLEKPAAS